MGEGTFYDEDLQGAVRVAWLQARCLLIGLLGEGDGAKGFREEGLNIVLPRGEGDFLGERQGDALHACRMALFVLTVAVLIAVFLHVQKKNMDDKIFMCEIGANGREFKKRIEYTSLFGAFMSFSDVTCFGIHPMKNFCFRHRVNQVYLMRGEKLIEFFSHPIKGSRLNFIYFPYTKDIRHRTIELHS